MGPVVHKDISILNRLNNGTDVTEQTIGTLDYRNNGHSEHYRYPVSRV